MQLADRVAKTDISGIRKVFDLAKTLKDPVNLSIGLPDFDVPEVVKDAAIEAIRSGKNAYTQTQGLPEIRDALCAKFDVAQESLLITSAVSGALTLAYLSLLNTGDEILVPDPYFVSYKQLALMVGATPVFFDTYPDFRIHIDRLEKLVTPRTKAIVFGNPSNPTGAVLPDADLQVLADFCKKHDLLAISDEIYDVFSYAPSKPFRAFYPKTLSLAGFSKTYGMTGWRLGYAIGPAELIAAMTKFQQFTFVCAPSCVQIAGVAALGVDMSTTVEAYKGKRDLVLAGLRAAGYTTQTPGGAFYIYPEIPAGYASGTQFVEEAIRHSLLVIPGKVFSEKDTNFRISYAAPDATLQRGVEILTALAQNPPKA